VAEAIPLLAAKIPLLCEKIRLFGAKNSSVP
jgi:hypothetical protein